METFVFVGVGLIVAALLGAQEYRRRIVSKASVVEAPAAQRRLIVTALFVSVALVCAAFATLAALSSSWVPALVFAAIAVGLCVILLLTRKPLGVLRLDAEQRELRASVREVVTRVDLGQPFQLRSDVKLSLYPRSQPWMLVTVEQDASTIAFCFPWTMRELASMPSTQTSAPLPVLMLDWRGALILERLRKLASA